VGGGAGAAVFAVGNHRGVEYVAGELLRGVTLHDPLKGAPATSSRFPPVELLELLQHITAAMVAVHQAGFAVGDLAPESVLVTGSRVVFGEVSLGQIPSVGMAGVRFAPEIVTGARDPANLTAAIAANVYGLGCLAFELATGAALFVAETVKAEMFGHGHHRPPALGEIRSDLPIELADLVGELLAKDPHARPRDAASVLSQLNVISERATTSRRAVRVLIVDEDADRVRNLWSVIRRTHPRSQVDAARDAREAVAKLTRDRPELVLIDASLGQRVPGMNALELIMYARGLGEVSNALLVVIGDALADADEVMLAQFGARLVSGRNRVGDSVADLVRQVATLPRATSERRAVTG
jgi:hypothetical protein